VTSADGSVSTAPAGDEQDPQQVIGQQLIAAVAVMDRLRSPGGCPWDAEQTHRSLLRYLIEECYELVQAVEDGDPTAIREELGDVLLQVLFHARIAAERSAADGGFDIDGVAADLVDKLVRRHPHVFDAQAAPVWTATDQQQRWDELKKTERGRSGVLDGVATGQPAAALAAKLGSRAAKFDLTVAPPVGDSAAHELFRIAYAAGARGEDPESALRAVALEHAAALAAVERVAAERPAAELPDSLRGR
jgi:XTP/dITP diphosphohydrolase